MDKSWEKVDIFKYLGMWLDKKGTWKMHVDKVEAKCRRVINLLRAIVGQEWGADRQAIGL